MAKPIRVEQRYVGPLTECDACGEERREWHSVPGRDVQATVIEIHKLSFLLCPHCGDDLIEAMTQVVERNLDAALARKRGDIWGDGEPEHFPARVWLQNGWWVECAGDGCLVHVDIDTVGGENATGRLFCNNCAQKQGLTRPDWATPFEKGANS